MVICLLRAKVALDQLPVRRKRDLVYLKAKAVFDELYVLNMNSLDVAAVPAILELFEQVDRLLVEYGIDLCSIPI